MKVVTVAISDKDVELLENVKFTIIKNEEFKDSKNLQVLNKKLTVLINDFKAELSKESL